MVDPFAAALDVLFRAPGSEAAIYTPPGGAAVTLRVIRTRPDHLSRFDGAQILPATNVFSILAADVAQPVIEATLAIAGETFVLSIEPIGDAEGLSWTCGAELAP